MPIGAFEAELCKNSAERRISGGHACRKPPRCRSWTGYARDCQYRKLYEILSKKTKLLMEGLEERASAAGIAFTTNHAGGMFEFFNKNSKVKTFTEVMESNNESFRYISMKC